MTKLYPKFYITLGESGESSVYIKDSSGDWQKFDNYEYFKVVKKQNQVSEFEIKIFDLQDTEKTYVKEFAEIAFYSETNLILKGRIQKITYETAYSCTATGYGAEAKLMEKELIKSNDKRVQYTNESAQTIAKELLSSNTDGSSPYIINPNTTGLFSTDWGDISMRYEYANRLKALAKLAESIDYEWWVSQQTGDPSSDYFNIAEYQPSTTRATNSQETFTITGANANCYLTKREKDITNLANKIDGLGYGDGVNQLHTSTYNASETYSTLASDITSSDTTITLADASSFPSSGEIRIMEERITYTGKSGNDLTGCTKGANGTTAREHKKGVYVEKYVDINSAESGSSIGTNGLLDTTITNKDIIDLPTLELVVSRELLDRMDPIERIVVIPNEPLETAGSREIGDLVTITDSESGLSGDYRIVGMTYESNYGDLNLEIECSNRSLTFIEQMQKQKEHTENMAKYMQGATNLYSIQSYENCDGSNPLYIRFYLPSDVVAINKVDMRFNTQKFRGYSTTTEVNSSSSEVNSSAGSGSGVNINSNVWTNIANITTDNLDCEGVFLNSNLVFVSVGGDTDNSSGYFKARIYDGTNYFPDSNGQIMCGGIIWGDEFMLNGNISRYIPGNNKNKTYTLQVKWYGWSNNFDWVVNGDINYSTFTRHTHSTGHSISEDTFPAGSPQLAIYVDDGAGGWTSVSGSPFNISDGGIYNVDITSEVSNLGVGSWVTIKCVPQSGTDHNNIRVEANVNVKVFIESK